MANFVDYEKRLDQLDQQKMNMINRMERADRKAYDEAAFYIGRMILNCYDGNQECVNYDGLEAMCQGLCKQINSKSTRDKFWVNPQGLTPGYNLAAFKDAVKKRNRTRRKYERVN